MPNTTSCGTLVVTVAAILLHDSEGQTPISIPGGLTVTPWFPDQGSEEQQEENQRACAEAKEDEC